MKIIDVPYFDELRPAQKISPISVEQFNLAAKLFQDADKSDKITEILLGTFDNQHHPEGTISIDRKHYYTRVLFPIVDAQELMDTGMQVIESTEWNFVPSENSQFLAPIEPQHREMRAKQGFKNKRLWMFRTFCRALGLGILERGSEQQKETFILDHARYNEIVFIKPTDEQVQQVIDNFHNSSYYQAIRNNERNDH